MASKQDVGLLEAFVNQILDTARLVVEQGDIRTVREREALTSAIHELEAVPPKRLIAAYQEADEIELADAGVVGQQLAAKVEIPRIFAELLRSESVGGPEPDDPVNGGRRGWRPRTGNVRRWIKRAKVLVGTLAGFLPPAEAFSELPDLLDAALVRPSRA